MEELENWLLESKYPMPKEDILLLIQRQYDDSIEWTLEKRQRFEERQKLYLNLRESWKNKVYVRYLFSVIDTLKALYFMDKPNVVFSPRKVWDEDLAQNINNLAQFDYGEMECFKKKERVQDNKFWYWAWIEVFTWFDKDTSTPQYKVVNPMCRVPDRFQNVNDWASFHWFEFEVSRWELDDSYDKDALDYRYLKSIESLTKDKKESIEQTRLLNSKWDYSTILYYHYFRYEYIWYLAVTTADRSELLKLEEIPAFTKAQKKNKKLRKCPVIVRNWRYLEDDPYGICVPDILEDKQMMMQLFMNLNRIKAEHEAYGDLFLFDPELVNVEDLKIPTTWRKFVKANLRSLNWWSPMMEVPKWAVKQDAYNMPWIMQQQWSIDIWLDDRSLWVSWDNNITARENQRVQKNANLKLILWAKIDWEAEKQFWQVWYWLYCANMKAWEKKEFALKTNFWQDYYSIKGDDFMTDNEVDVDILTEAEEEDKKQKRKLWLLATIQYVLQFAKSEYSKRLAVRMLQEYNDIPKDLALTFIDPSNDEMEAWDDVQLINNNEVPPISDDAMMQDHWTYILIYQKAKDTPAKNKAIQNRKMLAIRSGQTVWQQQMPVEWWGMTQAMVTNNMLQQANKQEWESLQTVMW